MSFHGERAQACCDLRGHDAPPPCPPPQLGTDPEGKPRDGTRRAGEHQPHTLTRRSHSWSYTSPGGRERSPQSSPGCGRGETLAIAEGHCKQHSPTDRPMFHTLTGSDCSRRGTVNDAVNYHIPAYSLDESDRASSQEIGRSDEALSSIEPRDVCECPLHSPETGAASGMGGHQPQGKESEEERQAGRGDAALSPSVLDQVSATGQYPSIGDPDAHSHTYAHPDHGHPNPRYIKNRRYGQVTPPYRLNDSDEEHLALEEPPQRPLPPLRRLSDLRSLTLTLGLQIHGSILNLAADKSRKQVHKSVIYSSVPIKAISNRHPSRVMLKRTAPLQGSLTLSSCQMYPHLLVMLQTIAKAICLSSLKSISEENIAVCLTTM